ncbi:MAG TPA: UbiD family decarboxylase, partial [Dehalococcoidia bacterium]|nr:UbiD family decarboxylase [Dehalococcoidia bacterium]
RFIGTADAIITKEPDGSWVNVGTYRVMVHDRNHVGLMIVPSHHGRWHMDQWLAQGKPMPVAIVAGMDPLLFVVASRELPAGLNEYEYAGAIQGEPVDVIEGPITGLPIPAGAEIVLEGFVDPEERRLEGPFGEYTGYYAGGVRPQPVVRVEAVYHRNNPIILGAPPLKPPVAREHNRRVMQAALILDGLEAAGIPDVVGAWPHIVGSYFIVIAIKQRYPGHAKQAVWTAAQSYAGGMIGRFTVVVDEDIDVTDLDEVLWAMCTRVDPDKDIQILKECSSSPLDPMVPPERKGNATSARVVIDATRPYEWRDRFPEVVASSPELKQQVLDRWGAALKGIV